MQNLNLSKQKILLKIQKLNLTQQKLNLKMLKLKKLAQVFLDRRSKKSPAMPNAVLQNTRAPKYSVPQWLCPNSWCSKC